MSYTKFIEIGDDKRLIPQFDDDLWCERKSIEEWHYCKYCYEDVPCFTCAEGVIGSSEPLQILLCCWQCGSGLEQLPFTEEDAEKIKNDEIEKMEFVAKIHSRMVRQGLV